MFKEYINGTPAYEITPLTMAVLSHYNEQGNLISRILEVNGEHFVNMPPSKLVDEACKFFGSSLKGRQDGTSSVAGITHKAPISVDPTNGMYFYPTASPISSKCSWIAHSYVSDVNKLSGNCSEIVFNNGQKVPFDISYGSMKNQIHRTAQFRFLLDKHINY